MKNTVDKAYGNVPKELPTLTFDISPFRGLKYYWLLFVRKIMR